MLDIILKEKIAEYNPAYAFPLGVLFSTIGLAMSVLVFKESPSFPAVFLTALAAMSIVAKITQKQGEGKLFQKYKYIIEIYSYLFFGMAVAFAIWLLILPEPFSSMIFKEQLLKFTVGYFTFQTSDLFAIVLNNTGLVLFFFILSLFYGAGSMFLLAWNASILGTMWGNAMKGLLISGQASYAMASVMAFPYMFPEVVAYFLAAIAGLILSMNIANKEKFDTVANESVALLFISIALIIASGIVETIILGL